jgi:hypothetical protein
MHPDSQAHIIAQAWFDIGGWALALLLAVWHWRRPIVDALERLLHVDLDDTVDRHPANPDAAPSLMLVSGSPTQLVPAAPTKPYAYVRRQPFATGGIVTGPTQVRIGGGGPEAVIPLGDR